MKTRILAVSFIGLFVAAAIAQDEPGKADKKPVATLKVGDKAPPLTVEKWLRGSEVKSFEKGKFYVVEFWATWCGPCITSMPHLTALQKEYKSKGVTIIGMTSADTRGNTLEKAEAMVKDKGDEGMGYTVAWDTERSTNDAYMKAAGQGGIPCSYVIDGTGTIAWLGHPMWLDYVIEPLVAGKWDAKTGPQTIEKAEKTLGSISLKARTDPKDALATWQSFEKDYPKVARDMSSMKLDLLLKAGEYDAAYKTMSEIVDTGIAKKDSGKLNEIAWMIVDPAGQIAKKDLELAMKAATKADELTLGEDPAIIDTLARVYFLKGNADKAIELQTKAAAAAKGDLKTELQKTLAEYKDSKKKND